MTTAEKLKTKWNIYAPIELIGQDRANELLVALHDLGFYWCGTGTKGVPCDHFHYNYAYLTGNECQEWFLSHTDKKDRLEECSTLITIDEVLKEAERVKKEKEEKTLEQKLHEPCQIYLGDDQSIKDITQKAALRMGFKWFSSGSEFIYFNNKYLEFNPPIGAFYSSNRSSLGLMGHCEHIRDDHHQITIGDFLEAAYEYNIKITPPRETITIGDSTFYKDDFEAATKDLERV